MSDPKPAAPPPAVPSVDSVTNVPVKEAKPHAKAAPQSIQKTKQILLAFGGVLYGVYALWSFALMSILPTTEPSLLFLTNIGVMTSLVGGAVFLIIGVVMLQRIMRHDVQPLARQRGLIRLGLTVLPGIVLSIFVPVVILQPAALPVEITPNDAAELVAPLAVTISLEKAATVLRKLGQQPIEYAWYRDGLLVEKTVVPKSTITFQRAGNYTISIRISMTDGSIRRVSKRITISEEVFSVTPEKPILELPTVFSIKPLLGDEETLTQVQWDFESDGEIDETTTTPEITHTFYSIGEAQVTAVVDLQNQTRKTYTKIVTVQEPPPLPFPLVLKTDPQKLVGPVPFGIYFMAETSEPAREIYWNYGDGEQERGLDLKRVTHIYKTPGTYSVLLRYRSGSGSVAELTTIVRATPVLTIADLTFSGSPDMKNGRVVSGEVPITVELTPQTSQPLIQFTWEVPDDIQAEVMGATFRAVFRSEGEYELKLLAQEPGGSSVRIPVKVVAEPPAAEPKINVRPEGGTAPLHVVFDASDTFIPKDESVAGFKWDFGDDENEEPITGSSRMEHTYALPGEYRVKLVVVTTEGKQYVAERTIIVRRQMLSACATPSRTSVSIGRAVQFDATCTTGDITSYLWDVRSVDRPNAIIAQSDEQTYVHVFEQEGEFTVTLTVEDDEGYSDQQSFTITVSP